MIVKEFEEIIESKNQLHNNWYIISEERLAGAGVGSGYDSSIISQRIKTSSPDAKILIMIREQKSILLSYYFQLLEGGLHDSFKKFIEPKNRYSKPGFALHFYDFNPLIKHYFELFGKENVLVLPFEMFTKHPNLFFKKLSSFLNININLSDLNVKKSANERSNYFILFYLRYFYTFSMSTPLNAYLFYYQPKIWKVLEIFFRNIAFLIPSFLNRYTKLKIKKEIERRVGNYYHESNKELEKLIETNLKEYGYFK